MADPGPNDGMLLVQLAQWGTMAGVDDAHDVIFAKDFDPDTADARDPAIRKILMWGETIATLTKNGLISQDLILDWLWMAGVWKRVGAAALAARQEMGEPLLYANFEALANAQLD